MLSEILVYFGLKNPPARTVFAWCPRCRRDLNGDNKSFVSDEEIIHYRCASCSCISWWDFDAPCPLLLGHSHHQDVTLPEGRSTLSAN